MQRMRQLALAVLAVSLDGCSFSPGDPTPSGPVRISGRILTYGTNAAVAGAAITLGGRTTSTDAAGWYSVDFGCPEGGVIGFNTTFMNVTHPLYADTSRVVGRGVFGVGRLDVELKRR